MKKVLIAEDCNVTRAILRKILANEGFVSIEATDGERALSVLQDNPDIELLITDMMMPKFSGRELVLTLRGNDVFKQLPIIVVSGIVRLSEIADILELGATRFLPKPLDTSHLTQYLRSLCSDIATVKVNGDDSLSSH